MSQPTNSTIGLEHRNVLGDRVHTYNLVSGIDVMEYNKFGVYNIAIGHRAGRYNLNGNYNILMGSGALYKSREGDYNVMIGTHGLYSHTDPQKNTGVGHDALFLNDRFNNTTAVGFNAQVTADNHIQMGDVNSMLYSYGWLMHRADIRDITNITNMSSIYKEFILGLRPVTFHFDYRESYRDNSDPESPDIRRLSELTHDGSHVNLRRHNGFVAQEVKELARNLSLDFEGFTDHAEIDGDEAQYLSYEAFIPPIVSVIQGQYADITSIQEHNTLQDEEIENLKRADSALAQMDAALAEMDKALQKADEVLAAEDQVLHAADEALRKVDESLAAMDEQLQAKDAEIMANFDNYEPKFDILPISKGGTGADNAPEARDNLGVTELVDNTIVELKTYSDTQDDLHLVDAKQYTDDQDAINLQNAKDYTDAEVAEATVLIKTYADTQDDAHLAEAKEYTDDQDAVTLAAAKSYADAQDVTNLTAAKTYADNKDVIVLSTAKAYTESQDALILAAAKLHADEHDAENLAIAKEYAENEADDAESNVRGGVVTAGDTLAKLYEMIVALQVLTASNDLNLDTLQEVVDFIKTHEGELNQLGVDSVKYTDIVNHLTQGPTIENTVLDARQGKVLKDLIDALRVELNTAIAKAKTDAVNESNVYADLKDANNLRTALEHADIQDASTLNAARDYADFQDDVHLQAAKDYTDAKDAAHLAEAKTYADTQDAANLVVAKAYTDTQVAATLAAAKSYADNTFEPKFNVLPINKGGTGMTTNPSMLTNLASTTAASVFAASPRPGVTGTLPIANGGTSMTTNPSMLVNLGTTMSATVFAAYPRPGVTGTLPIANGGTNQTTNPSMLTNLASTNAASVFATDPRPGVTGTLPIGNGGTSMTSNPSLLVNLDSTSAANVFAASPRPGVTGTLAVANGGTDANNPQTARSNLGIQDVTGQAGQAFFLQETNNRTISPRFIMQDGRYVNNAQQLAAEMARVPSFQEVFNNWNRFNVGTGIVAGEENAWIYDAANNRIVCQVNSTGHIGFISNTKYTSYTHECVVTSTNGDNDMIGIVIAAVSVSGTWHTITAVRVGSKPAEAHVLSAGTPTSWALVYNFRCADAILLANGNAAITVPSPEAAGNGPWSTYPVGCKINVRRDGDNIWATTSQLGDLNLDNATTLTLNLTSRAELAKFRGGAAYGYSSTSQDQATFSNVVMSDASSNIIALHTGRIYVWRNGTWIHDANQTLAQNVNKGQMLVNIENRRMFFVRDFDDIVEIPL